MTEFKKKGEREIRPTPHKGMAPAGNVRVCAESYPPRRIDRHIILCWPFFGAFFFFSFFDFSSEDREWGRASEIRESACDEAFGWPALAGFVAHSHLHRHGTDVEHARHKSSQSLNWRRGAARNRSCRATTHRCRGEKRNSSDLCPRLCRLCLGFSRVTLPVHPSVISPFDAQKAMWGFGDSGLSRGAAAMISRAGASGLSSSFLASFSPTKGLIESNMR